MKNKKRFLKSIVSMIFCAVIILNFNNNTLAANNNQNNGIDIPIQIISENEEYSSDEMIEKLTEQGKEILSFEEFSMEIPTNDLERRVAIINFGWAITHDPKLGLENYIEAYTKDLKCLITTIRGNFSWRSTSSLDQGSLPIYTKNNLATYRIANHISTNRIYPRGTTLKCSINVDVNALSEISGGQYSSRQDVKITK